MKENSLNRTRTISFDEHMLLILTKTISIAKFNNRSLSGEIVNRLKDSLIQDNIITKEELEDYIQKVASIEI